MKKASLLVLVVMVIALLAGCTTVLPGEMSSIGSKSGESVAQVILGFPMGDASVATAAANAGITTVTSYDIEVFTVTPMYVQITTKVTGN